MKLLQLLIYNIFGSGWIPIEPRFMRFKWINGSNKYNLMYATEMQYKPLFGGKRWRGELIGTFHTRKDYEDFQ